MLKIPLSDIVTKIKQDKGLSEEEINNKIDSKMQELSGLISKEGAAHIIANELGVKVFEQTQGRLQIKNILMGLRNVETAGKVVRVFELREFKTDTRQGKVSSMIIGDETGTIRITMWGDQADNINSLKEGDIVRIEGGYVRENMGRKEVHLNDRSNLIINPEGVVISDVKENDFPKAVRKEIKDLDESDQNVEILGTIVQVYDIRFFEVCPECNKRALGSEGSYKCNVHGDIKPDYSYVLNLTLDDGTETIRCTFFRNQLERLLEKSKEDMIKYKDDPASFESVKTEMLGNMVKLVGRVNKNEMFDRIEFVSQLVFNNPDPNEEIKRIQKEGQEIKDEPKEKEDQSAVSEETVE